MIFSTSIDFKRKKKPNMFFFFLKKIIEMGCNNSLLSLGASIYGRSYFLIKLDIYLY